MLARFSLSVMAVFRFCGLVPLRHYYAAVDVSNIANVYVEKKNRAKMDDLMLSLRIGSIATPEISRQQNFSDFTGYVTINLCRNIPWHI
jgi:hypothetical protein